MIDGEVAGDEAHRDFHHTPDPPPPRTKLWLSIALAAAVTGVVAYWLTSWTIGDYRAIGRGVSAAESGAWAESRATLEPLTGHALFGPAAGDGIGLMHALQGDLEAARQQFAAVGPGAVRFSRVDWFAIVRDLVERGEYDRAALLADQAIGRRDSVRMHMLRGMAADGMDQVKTARRELANGVLRPVFEEVRRGKTLLVGGIFPDAKFLALYTRHVESVGRKEKSGVRAYVLDRAGKPLFQVAVGSGAPSAIPAELVALVSPLDPTRGLARLFDARDRRNVVTTTLDPGVQRVAYRALGKQAGGIVVLDMEGGIVAAAGRAEPPRAGRRGGANRPADDAIDPLGGLVPIASVAKLPTLIAALGNPASMQGVFPFRCHDPIRVDGTALNDWMRHGILADEAEALAVSCNLTFARLALKLGREQVIAGFAEFGFEGAEHAAAASPYGPAIGILPAAVEGDRALAELAVGLEGPRGTLPLAAAIALAIANGGEWREPHLVRSKASIGGIDYLKPEPVRRRVATEAVAARVTRGMVRAVEAADGTARRARPQLLTLAAKTGTAGSWRTGYQAIVVGFAPAERPRYAFAVYITGGGRADISAAPVSKDLLEGLQQLEAERARTVGGLW